MATLLYLNSVEEAFHRKNGRYGTLRELADAGLLALDVPFDASGFKRARYAFRVTVEADGYRAEAMPAGSRSGGRSSWTTAARSGCPTSGASVVRRTGLGEVRRYPVEELLRLLEVGRA